MSRSVRFRPLESWVLLHPPSRPHSPDRVVAAPRKQKPPRIFDVVLTTLAWLIIIVIVAGVAISTMLNLDLKKSPVTDRVQENIEGLQERIESRYIVGVANLFKQAGPQGLTQLSKLSDGSVRNHFRYVILTGEMAGAKEALRELDTLEDRRKTGNVNFSGKDQKLAETLRRLYGDYNVLRLKAPSVSNAERALLDAELGWTGKLALAPKNVSAPENVAAGAGAAASVTLSTASDAGSQRRNRVLAPAYRTVFGILIGFGLILTLGCIGLVGLTVCLVLVFTGKIRSSIATATEYRSAYIETFALWLVAFLGLGLAAAHLPWRDIPLLMRWRDNTLLVSMVAMFLSLGVLVWPLIRGFPLRKMRHDFGLTFGPKPLQEILMGPACYVLTLPIAAVGILITFFLMLAQGAVQSAFAGASGAEPAGGAAGPTHPIMGFFSSNDPFLWAQIFLVAAVAAPIVEETMFRGVLYRHLRELTGRWGLLLSVLASSFLVSFLFAAVHPQGWLAWPALGSLAMGFALMREWRGSLIASMIAHGINNGLLMLIALIIFMD